MICGESSCLDLFAHSSAECSRYFRSVWDLKKLLGMPDDDHSSAAYGDDFSDCVVATYEHTKACSSTYFDRSGTKILTTSYDDVLRGE